MACYHPIKAYRSKEINKTGKRSIVFNIREAVDDKEVTIQCGQCIGCKLERSRQWAVRCMHEASLHQDNAFITLTFNDQHLPKDNSLNVKIFQDFMKRLRKKYEPKTIRFFHCGEYGQVCETCRKSEPICRCEQFIPRIGRPHYHALLFGHDFSDKVHHQTIRGNKLYTSAQLEKLWSFGFSTIGEVNFETAAYVARYITKKITGDKATEHYTDFDRFTGEIHAELQPEYTTMSRRPGIGKNWIDKYMGDVYPHDYVVIEKKDTMVKVRPPKYYDTQHELTYPFDHDEIKERRQLAGLKHVENNTYERLRAREELQLRKFKQLKRGLESTGE